MATIYEIRTEQEDGTWRTLWRTTSPHTAHKILREQQTRAANTHGRPVALFTALPGKHPTKTR